MLDKENFHNYPILVTLTAPTCAGKSFLLQHIRDVAKLPCLVGTTTRPPRQGEVEGVDYYFISEEKSREIEARDGYAEMATYRGIRYGVTWEEFKKKISTGLTFLIVEPSGIDHYVKPMLDVGAKHLKYFVHTDISERLERFKERTLKDTFRGVQALSDARSSEQLLKSIASALDRQHAMLTVEQEWFRMVEWDRILFGDKSPEHNLEIILKDVEEMKERQYEIAKFHRYSPHSPLGQVSMLTNNRVFPGLYRNN